MDKREGKPLLVSRRRCTADISHGVQSVKSIYNHESAIVELACGCLRMLEPVFDEDQDGFMAYGEFVKYEPRVHGDLFRLQKRVKAIEEDEGVDLRQRFRDEYGAASRKREEKQYGNGSN